MIVCRVSGSLLLLMIGFLVRYLANQHLLLVRKHMSCGFQFWRRLMPSCMDLMRHLRVGLSKMHLLTSLEEPVRRLT